MVVLSRAKREDLNHNLSSNINATSKMFVSATAWQGKPVCRIAISNWRVDEERDYALVTDFLETSVL